MKLILLVHPSSLISASMPRFARMIGDGMLARGHEVQYWTSPQDFFSHIPTSSSFIKKWLSYVDQYMLYPSKLKRAVQKEPEDTIFVFTDQALGMWVPLIAHRPHVIHCHDFMALRSSLGEIPQNPISWTGKHYQRLIKKGFNCGSNFISVSKKTQSDLHRFLEKEPKISEVVHNGLNYPFAPIAIDEAWRILACKVGDSMRSPILHVGGNLWYKNRDGVLELYIDYAEKTENPYPLWMVGDHPCPSMLKISKNIRNRGSIHFFSLWSNEELRAAYSIARVLLFPSLDEGFGWPIAEAMACGCPVITTNQAPMSEVGGDAAFYLSPRHYDNQLKIQQWFDSGVDTLRRVTELTDTERSKISYKCRQQAAAFQADLALDQYESIYKRVLNHQ